MKTAVRRVFLALLACAALVVIVPGQAMAGPWCNQCDATGDCFACCKCDGGTARQCIDECSSAVAGIGKVAFLTDPTCDAPSMSVAPTQVPVEAETAEVVVVSDSDEAE